MRLDLSGLSIIVITNERNIQGMDIKSERNVQGTDITSERNVQGHADLTL